MKHAMIRLQIAGLLGDLEAVLAVLQRLACVEISPVAESLERLPADAQKVKEEEALAYLLTRLDGLLAAVGAAKSPGATPSPIMPAETAALEQVTAEIKAAAEKRDALSNEQTALPRYVTTLRKLVPLVPADARRPDTVSTVVIVADSHRWVLRTLESQVKKLSGSRQHIVEQSIGDGLRAMLIVAPRDQAPALRALLGQQEIAQMQMPDAFADLPPDVAVARLEQRLAQLPGEIAAVDAQLRELGRVWGPRLWRRRQSVAARLARLQIQRRLGATARTFILEGWTPARDEAGVREALNAFPTLSITTHPPEPQDDVPVALNNPGPVRPFESLVRLMVYPRYDGIDPTPLMALFLPLFFGMILGDLGYAFIIFVATAAGLRRIRTPGTVRDLLQILLMGSIWGAVFGLLYGEAFGTVGEEFGLHPLWLDRAAPDYVTSLLLFTIGVGVVHVMLGLLLGIWFGWQLRSRHHLLERGGMLLGLVGLLLLVGALTQQIPAVFTTPGVAVLVIGVVLLSANHGWLGILLGPIEFIGLLGNVLSYLRIAAVGLASVYVALVANELAGNLGSLLLGIVVAVLIHALNVVLGAFSPTIHSLRLHYVEFFRKFYEGGGRPFEPFGGATT